MKRFATLNLKKNRHDHEDFCVCRSCPCRCLRRPDLLHLQQPVQRLGGLQPEVLQHDERDRGVCVARACRRHDDVCELLQLLPGPLAAGRDVPGRRAPRRHCARPRDQLLHPERVRERHVVGVQEPCAEPGGLRRERLQLHARIRLHPHVCGQRLPRPRGRRRPVRRRHVRKRRVRQRRLLGTHVPGVRRQGPEVRLVVRVCAVPAIPGVQPRKVRQPLLGRRRGPLHDRRRVQERVLPQRPLLHAQDEHVREQRRVLVWVLQQRRVLVPAPDLQGLLRLPRKEQDRRLGPRHGLRALRAPVRKDDVRRPVRNSCGQAVGSRVARSFVRRLRHGSDHRRRHRRCKPPQHLQELRGRCKLPRLLIKTQ